MPKLMSLANLRPALVLVAMVAALLAAERPLEAAQETPLYWLSDFSEVQGSNAELFRRDDRVSYVVNSAGLEPGHVFTLWFCGWNYPAVCVGGPGTCGAVAEDLAFDLKGAFCLWGGGAQVATDGTIEIQGTFQVNEPIGEVLFGAFTRPRKAEINLVLKSHGLFLDEREVAQRTTYDGGCSWNVCEELQIAIFPGQ